MFMESIQNESVFLLFLDASTNIKHLQIPQMPLQRLTGEMHNIYKIGVSKPVYCHCTQQM